MRYFNPVGAHGSGRVGEQPVTAGQNLVPAVMRVALGESDRLQVYGDDYDTPDGTAVGTTVLELVAAAEAATGQPIPCEITDRQSGEARLGPDAV